MDPNDAKLKEFFRRLRWAAVLLFGYAGGRYAGGAPPQQDPVWFTLGFFAAVALGLVFFKGWARWRA